MSGTKQVTLSIEGMNCGGCAKGVQTTLACVPGVEVAAVDFVAARASVQYDPAAVAPNDLVEALARTGFSAQELAA